MYSSRATWAPSATAALCSIRRTKLSSMLCATMSARAHVQPSGGASASASSAPFAPTSPQPLLQEYYCEEPWRLLVCCALMSRVSSHETKTRCIEGFFEFCPTPTAFLEAESPDVEAIINPLGLFDSRYRTLVELSSRFLQMPIFEIGHEKGVNKIYGCGVFTVDSYHIFCKDDRSTRPDDLALKGYCSWRDAEFGKAK